MAVECSVAELSDWVGKETGTSDWFEIDQARINDFAETTLDRQYIHIDEEKAKQTPFGGTIAHGFLTLSLTAHFAEATMLKVAGAAMYINYGMEGLRFLTPVRAGKKVRLKSVLKAVDEKGGGRYLLTVSQTVEIEGEAKPALVADALTMVVVG